MPSLNVFVKNSILPCNEVAFADIGRRCNNCEIEVFTYLKTFNKNCLSANRC